MENPRSVGKIRLSADGTYVQRADLGKKLISVGPVCNSKNKKLGIPQSTVLYGKE